MVNLAQLSNSDPSPTYSLNVSKVSYNHPRDLSFSSYLNPTKEAVVHKLVQPGGSLGFNDETGVEHLCYLRGKVEDGEIGVFEAEKYFNGEIDREESPKIAVPSKKLVHLERKKEETEGERGGDIVMEPGRSRVQMGTPSIRPNLSMNSQSALLRNIVRSLSRKRIKEVNCSRSLLAVIGCKCSCSDKASADVVDGENITDFSTSLKTKSSAVGAVSICSIAPTSDPGATEEIHTHKLGKLRNFARKTFFDLSSWKPVNGEAEPRKSLDVSGSPSFGKKGNGMETSNLERRLTLVNTWKPNLRKEAGSEFVDEIESDASSDLFEIESLTGKVKSNLTRPTSNATSNCTTPRAARYAPSEASIEWSVVTAAVADFSVLSDYDEAVSRQLADTKCSGQANNGIEEAPERQPRAGILLGCRGQKAVQVAGEVHKFTSERFRLDPGMGSGRSSDLTANPVARFPAEARLMGSDHKCKNQASHLLYVGK